MKKTVLGVKIDDLNADEALELVEEWLKQDKKHYIVTPNPEFVMSAQEDSEFKGILNKADLNLPDGHGLKLAGVQNIIAGTDFMVKLCEAAAQKNWRVGLLGGRGNTVKLCAEVLKRQYPKLQIVFADSGGEVDGNGKDKKDATSLTAHCSLPNTDLLFVALGHGKQEKWIFKNKDKISAKVFMGVGGAFDYIAGVVPRAPLFIRQAGLEWLFRLVIQPWRIKRQLQLFWFMFQVVSSK